MTEETTRQSKGIEGHAGGCQCGCETKPQATVAEDEKATRERLTREEVVRARNKRVRAPSTAPGPDSDPPFTDHSGAL